MAIGTLVVLQNIVHAKVMVIQVSGSLGQSVRAAFIVDGESRTETAEMPAKFIFTASRLSYSIVPVANPPDKNLIVKTFIDGEYSASCSSPAVKGTITGNSLLNLDRGGEAIGGMTAHEIAEAQ